MTSPRVTATVADPESQQARWPMTAVMVAAGVGAAALPLTRVGIGWPICALAGLGVALAARAGRSAGGALAVPPERSAGGTDRGGSGDWVWQRAAGAAALVLATVPAIRASEPLAALCLITAALLAWYAVTGGRTWAGIAAGLAGFVPTAFRSLGSMNGRGSGRTSRAGRLALGGLAGAVLLLVFGALLSAADPVFADLLRGWGRALSQVDIARVVLGAALVGWAGIVVAYQLTNRPEPVAGPARIHRRMLGAAEWVIPLVLLDALFGVFVFVQLTVLFGGNDYVLGAGGPDYADYARAGFAQLGVVTALTLGVVAALAAWARRDSTLDIGLIRGVGGVLCGLTLVIVASALRRLALYAGAYGFTWPRLLGFAGEVWLGLIFVLVLAAGARLRADWMPRAVLAAGVGVLFALVAVNPEALIARTVLDRVDGPYPVDYGYLAGLSTDAIGALDRLPADRRDCAVDAMTASLGPSDPWYGLNLSRQQARAASRRLGRRDPCPASGRLSGD